MQGLLLCVRVFFFFFLFSHLQLPIAVYAFFFFVKEMQLIGWTVLERSTNRHLMPNPMSLLQWDMPHFVFCGHIHHIVPEFAFFLLWKNTG